MTETFVSKLLTAKSQSVYRRWPGTYWIQLTFNYKLEQLATISFDTIQKSLSHPKIHKWIKKYSNGAFKTKLDPFFRVSKFWPYLSADQFIKYVRNRMGSELWGYLNFGNEYLILKQIWQKIDIEAVVSTEYGPKLVPLLQQYLKELKVNGVMMASMVRAVEYTLFYVNEVDGLSYFDLYLKCEQCGSLQINSEFHAPWCSKK